MKSPRFVLLLGYLNIGSLKVHDLTATGELLDVPYCYTVFPFHETYESNKHNSYFDVSYSDK